MQFIEMTGRQLLSLVNPEEMDPNDLRQAGVKEESIVRVNPQGDIELRLKDRWEIIGGLIGDFQHRVEGTTGHIFADTYSM